ncbi:DNA alkylation repair protein [Undibacterium parvum]|uniref:DNA alkylation repair protein n=1 Tax=Undibacterium parvum TaxID=401471 RepID=A0A3Q9BQ39_9BURK|nr:DNA alkylation repair protein [Undibacterium parvum]AZP11877.1 DNA alkylation repair protein [Undibacterium parvum]
MPLDSAFTCFQQQLSKLAQPQKAPAMAAYMQHHFAFLGVAAPARRQACKPLIKAFKGCTAARLLSLAEQLWTLPEREYQYLAIDLLAQHYRQLSVQDIPQLLQLVQNKSWWDSVDALAGVIGDVLFAQRSMQMSAQADCQSCMDAALQHPNFWLRRVTILHQLGWREATDVTRLFTYAKMLAPEKEFFIRKAIGWALRDYARHDSEAVRGFLVAERTHLSGLSYREASKHLPELGISTRPRLNVCSA